MDGTSVTQSWQASAFNDMLKLVFSLPIKLHEKLAHTCPNFNKLLHSTEPRSIVLTDARTNIERILQLLPPDVERQLLEELIEKFNKQKPPRERIKTIESTSDGKLHISNEIDNNQQQSDSNKAVASQTQEQKQDSEDSLFTESECNSKPELPPRRYSLRELYSHDQASDKSLASARSAIDRLESLVLGDLEPSAESCIKIAAENQASTANNPVYPEVTVKNQAASQNIESKSQSSGMGTPLAHSTPFGTMSTVNNNKNQLNPKPPRKRRKRKKSRWNFAARFCSSGRSNTFSDSESMESAIYLQAARPKVKVIKHHGRQGKGYKWLFKINKQ